MERERKEEGRHIFDSPFFVEIPGKIFLSGIGSERLRISNLDRRSRKQMQGEKMPGMLTAVKGGRGAFFRTTRTTTKNVVSSAVITSRSVVADLVRVSSNNPFGEAFGVGAVEHPPPRDNKQSISTSSVSQCRPRAIQNLLFPLSFETTKRGGNVRTGVGDTAALRWHKHRSR